MEYPAIQLENMRPSGLKPPSKLPAFTATRTLQDTTLSDLNIKTAGQGSMLPPQSVNGTIKHKISGLPEPPSKRKTLVERAGEPANPLRSHTSNKASIGSTSGFGSRPASNLTSYRNTSNASTASSIGGPRPTGRQTNGVRQPGMGRPPSASTIRAQSDDQESDAEAGNVGMRKGTPILSFTNPVNGICLRKTRTHGELRQKSQLQARPVRSRSQHSGSSVSDYSDDGDIFGQTSRSNSSSSTSSAPHPALAQPGGPAGASQSSRNVSISTALAELNTTPNPKLRDASTKHRPSLERIKEEVSPSKIPKYSCTPKLRHAHSTQALQTPTLSKQKASLSGLRTPVTGGRRGDVGLPRFLTKEKLSPVAAFDTNNRLDNIERMYDTLRTQMESATESKNALEESLAMYKSRVEELTKENREMSSQTRGLTSDLERSRNELHTTATDLRHLRRDHEREIHDLARRHERELESLQDKNEKEQRRLEREREKEVNEFERKMEAAKNAWDRKQDVETADLTSQHWEEMEQLRNDHDKAFLAQQKELDRLKLAGESRATESASEVQLLRETVASLQSQIDASNATIISLRSRITTYETKIAEVEQQKSALVSKTHFLEGNQEAQSQEFTTMRDQMENAIAAREAATETLRKEETLRRKLNAMILELRGNIRVFVRTRPLLNGEEDPAKVEYLGEDSLEGCKEMVVHAPTTQTATGKQKNEKHNYAFDRVFAPGTDNTIVFEECRELIQSVVDGYNVSILSYGQTGSGKTFGMTGPDGIIPSAIRLLLSEMSRLRDRGWEYAVDASFVEVYNETLNDLLGDAKTWDEVDDLGASVRGKRKEKHEIHHDAATGKTSVANLTAIGLWPPPTDEGAWPPAAPVGEFDVDGSGSSYTEKAAARLLDTAAKNRRVAATKANERSSRSHSIFMLTLRGTCAATNESSEGVLNLVDLAGSERLKQSGAEGSRMKETQAINKSLSSLGDVIAALGNKSGNSDAHVPYRNSKLTYLLQSSLGGTTAGKSSRTLMLLHLSPLLAHWQESRSSLLFGSKVASTHIGAAKKR